MCMCAFLVVAIVVYCLQLTCLYIRLPQAGSFPLQLLMFGVVSTFSFLFLFFFFSFSFLHCIFFFSPYELCVPLQDKWRQVRRWTGVVVSWTNNI